MATVITIMGNIGSGKSVQAQKVAERLNWVTFSTGQLVRESNIPEVVDAHNQGKLAPTEYIQKMILDKIKSIDPSRGIIMDGSPRMLVEAVRYDSELPKIGRKLDLVIMLSLSETESIERLKKRGRVDDTPKAIAERFRTFEEEVKPVIDRYRERGIVREIDAGGSIEAVTERIMEALQGADLA